MRSWLSECCFLSSGCCAALSCDCGVCVQELVSDAAPQVSQLLSYPLADTLSSGEAKSVVEDNFKEVGVCVCGGGGGQKGAGVRSETPGAMEDEIMETGRLLLRGAPTHLMHVCLLHCSPALRWLMQCWLPMQVGS
jgi:hypothetical protein